jgi:hypothetical protein
MRGPIVTVVAYAVGIIGISVTSVMIYQHVTPVAVVSPPPLVVPAVPEKAPVPPALQDLLEPLEGDDAKPAGRFLAMPKTGRE